MSTTKNPKLNTILNQEGAILVPQVSKKEAEKILGHRYIRRFRKGVVEFIGECYAQDEQGEEIHGAHQAIVIY